MSSTGPTGPSVLAVVHGDDALRGSVSRRRDRTAASQERVDSLENDIDAFETGRGGLDAIADAALNRADANTARIAELQTRSLLYDAQLSPNRRCRCCVADSGGRRVVLERFGPWHALSPSQPGRGLAPSNN
ncbi:hypothetical protein [Natrinema halophilum]|uniref:Uncharacterized protein n=1 Tax=Natrinema halophilum TaxID=1699371 RepID=A0A7D5KDR6_9EURY|nr:hypothetical protein [Natrinema halophilum]QLG49641.1 hypothetical protein HYG82_12600 [Natrinema halophilum]